ncbi:EAL domain-containing protein [Bacillus sp. EB600]|nr:EAL domain-containing protein [Bacillus sp. EB600]
MVNVAGRERMLTQKMSKIALLLAYSDDVDARKKLITTSHEFEDKLNGLIYGNYDYSLASLKDMKLDKQLKNVERQWKTLKQDIMQIVPGKDNQTLTIQQINTKSDQLVQQLDLVVETIEKKDNHSWQGIATDKTFFILLNVIFVTVLFVMWLLLSSLSKSEEKYRLLVHNSPIGILIVKGKKVHFINHFALKALGFSHENNMIGKSIHTFIHPDYESAVNSRLENVYEHKKVAELMEEKWLHKNGTMVNVEVMSIPYHIMGDNTTLCIFFDITKHKRYENEFELMHIELDNIRTALDQSSIVEITDTSGKIQYVNDKFCEISKYSKEEIIGNTYRFISSGYHSKEFYKNLWETIRSGNTWEGQVRNRAKDGSYYWVNTMIIPFINHHGNAYQYLTIRNDITNQKNAEKKLEILATRDGLTNLSNRRIFINEMEKTIAAEQPMAVLFLDLDRFKYVNDTLGHAVGDQLLQEVSNRLQEVVSEQGLISRQGGDEFTILVNTTERPFLSDLCQQIIRNIKYPYSIEEKEIVITCSIGISIYPDNGNDVETLMKNADLAMYWSKDNGKNNFSFFQEFMKEKSSRIMQLELELRKAIENEEFFLCYQPKAELNNGEIIGCEALIRWEHPAMGIITPAEFIPLAEDTGLINQIGEWVLREACKQTKSWHEAGYAELKMAVNLSVHQLNQANIVELVETILLEHHLDPGFLELEITESISMLSEKSKIKNLFALKELGVSIAIDDFGTGYSSLKYLHELPVNTLKIDKSFIKDIGQLNRITPSLMTNAILSLARSLHLEVVAEGIETIEQMNYLKKYQCKIGQGYFISKPLPADKMETFLNKNGKKQYPQVGPKDC